MEKSIFDLEQLKHKESTIFQNKKKIKRFSLEDHYLFNSFHLD